MLKKVIKDKVLMALIAINFVDAIAYFIGGSIINIKYITLGLTFLILFFCKQEKSLPIVFYLHCNSALYDDIGFSYIFNFAIMIVLFKEIFFYYSNLKKNTTFVFLFLFFYNIGLIFLKNVFTINTALSMLSWGVSYLLLILYTSSQKTDFEVIYRYFFVGFVMACVCAAIIPFKKWGINIPTAYRFIGLLRDPNYYSVDALFLIFSARAYSEKINTNPLIYMISMSALGILSVSKMFILLLAVGLILYVMLNASNAKIKPYQFIFAISLLGIAFVIAYNSNFLDTIISKYTYRTQTTTLLTSRDKLQTYYLNYLFNNPIVLLFGNSTSYSVLSDVGSYAGDFFAHMVAHNTYLDILMSWGIVFSSIYVLFIYKVFKNSYKTETEGTTSDSKVLTIILLMGLFSLSYLQADVFALFILYIILVSKKGNEVELSERHKNIYDNT